MGLDYRMIDIAQAITRFSYFYFPVGHLDPQNSRILIEAYQKKIDPNLAITRKELEHLNTFLAYSHWLLLDYLMPLKDPEKTELKNEFIEFTKKMILSAWDIPIQDLWPNQSTQ